VNLILLLPDGFTRPDRATLRNRRLQVQQPTLGLWMKVDVLNNQIKRALVMILDDQHIEQAV